VLGKVTAQHPVAEMLLERALRNVPTETLLGRRALRNVPTETSLEKGTTQRPYGDVAGKGTTQRLTETSLEKGLRHVPYGDVAGKGTAPRPLRRRRWKKYYATSLTETLLGKGLRNVPYRRRRCEERIKKSLNKR
jgi:hypothetical protein